MKRLLSVFLAITMLMTTFMSTTAFAVEESESARETKIYFEAPEDWGTLKNVYCHIYPVYGGKEIKQFAYQSKSEKCELVDGESNLYSFDTSKYCLDTDTSGYAIEDNADYGVLFSVVTTEIGAVNIYNLTLGSACMGDTVYITGIDTSLAPQDGNRSYIAEWKNNSDKYGRGARITSKGEIKGEYFPVYQPIEEIVAKWLGGWAVYNETIITTEKVKSVCDDTGAEPQKVYDAYAEMYADELADIENNPTIAPLEKIRELLELTRETKIYFEAPEDWGTIRNAYCYIYPVYGGKEIKELKYYSKGTKCELVDGESNLFSFDTSNYCLDTDTSGYAIDDNADYGVIFTAVNTEGISRDTYNLTLGSACMGDTVYVTGTDTSGPMDVGSIYIAAWRNNFNKYGKMASITADGEVLGKYFPVYQPIEEIIADWLGEFAVYNELIITTEKVMSICIGTDAEPQKVYNAYAEMYADELADIENNPSVAPLEKIRELLELTRETKIYFEAPEIWGTVEKAYCHIYPVYGGKEIKQFAFQSKKEKCELVDGESNLYSFDTSKYCLDTDTSGYAIEDNADYGVLFSAINTEGRAFETYSITLGIACMGDTAYVTGGDTTFAPDDFNRVYIAEWKNNSDKYGREARITSVGKITGEYFPVYQPIEEIVAKWLAGWAVLNEEIITTEKVKSVCTETGAEPQKVYDAYAEMFADELADIENNPSVASLDKIAVLLGLVIDTLGDVNNDGTINITDATEIMKYSAMLLDETQINLEYADVNGDGMVNVMDATAIQKTLAGI